MTLRSRIDLNLLAVFDAIYVRASVTQAARHLNLSQSAISHALGRLRREFDDPLFVRSGNALVPTALARSIVDPVRNALRGIEVAVAAASRFDPATTTRQFRIGLRPSAEARLFADLVVRATRIAPAVQLASVDFRRGDLAHALAQGELDLAIDIPSDASATLRTLPLQSDVLVVAARPGHPRMDGAIDLATYLALDHVIASPRPAGLGAEDDALAAIGRQRRVTMRSQHVSAAWQIVAASELILTLPRSHAEMMRPVAELQLMPLPLDVPPRGTQLQWHEVADRDPGNMWLRSIVCAHFSQSHE